MLSLTEYVTHFFNRNMKIPEDFLPLMCMVAAGLCVSFETDSPALGVAVIFGLLSLRI